MLSLLTDHRIICSEFAPISPRVRAVASPRVEASASDSRIMVTAMSCGVGRTVLLVEVDVSIARLSMMIRVGHVMTRPIRAVIPVEK